MIQSIVSTASTDSARLVWKWQLRLGLARYLGRIEAVDPLQVTGEDGRPGAEMVGVIVEAQRFTIVHTRPLEEADVIHELLHVAYPAWEHETVEFWTERLLRVAAEAPLGGATSKRASKGGTR